MKKNNIPTDRSKDYHEIGERINSLTKSMEQIS
jgi:hypothetical protein